MTSYSWWIAGVVTYVIGLLACLVYAFFDEEEPALYIFMGLLWPLFLGVIVLFGPFIWLGGKFGKWRKEFLITRKMGANLRRARKERKEKEAEEKAKEEAEAKRQQENNDYRHMNCPHCGQVMEKKT